MAYFFMSRFNFKSKIFRVVLVVLIQRVSERSGGYAIFNSKSDYKGKHGWLLDFNG